MGGVEVRLEGVYASYGEVEALRGVSFSFPESSITAVLGPSGCGKTTMLKVIAGLLRPAKGRVLFGGVDYTSLPPERRNVGFVFQDLALFPHMTVYDNVAFGLRARGFSESGVRRQVEWALETVGLTPPREYWGRRVTSLSGGQQQRVALARAIAYEPPVLLLDEPLSHLDFKIRQRLLGELKRLQRKLGSTMIYVTHDQWEAMELADTLVIMRAGRIVQHGSPVEVYTKPSSVYVATFFGDANILPKELLNPGSGDGSAVVVRPEDLEIVRNGSSIPPEWPRLEAVVEDLVFQGPLIRVELRWKGGRLKAVVPRSMAASLPRPGELVSVTWSPERGVDVALD
ncbi:ABC transporter ATP-binding protein [Aeropyrum camini]|uniref:Molybdate/tungstate import ATP-binding protein WtpC n=1 Tax=Aeropyrum camini SY1 = JCM 12091 TaxID=1198449 RepID=U3TCC8_9CREN|nr:ABC transporter ATP-binding protein [Aeropyrum camini]BAN90086.1 spermidine/putrescine ABC transporter [Aeropyrum camini SY1 = JCM 12091]